MVSADHHVVVIRKHTHLSHVYILGTELLYAPVAGLLQDLMWKANRFIVGCNQFTEPLPYRGLDDYPIRSEFIFLAYLWKLHVNAYFIRLCDSTIDV